MEIKIEADSSVCPHCDHQITCMFLIFDELLLSCEFFLNLISF